jgi:hypothetical protein
MAERRPRTIRVSDALWHNAGQRAHREHTNLSERVNVFLEQYADEDVETSLAEELRRIAVRLNDLRSRLS